MSEVTKNFRRVDWMSIGIQLDKKTDSFADYIFIADVWDKDPRFVARSMIVGRNHGLFRLHLESGEIELLLPMEDDDEHRRFVSAAHKIKQHWDVGEIPQFSQYACG